MAFILLLTKYLDFPLKIYPFLAMAWECDICCFNQIYIREFKSEIEISTRNLFLQLLIPDETFINFLLFVISEVPWFFIFLRKILVLSLYVCMLSHFSRVQLFVTPWTVACLAPLSMGFSRQEYWSGLSCPSSLVGIVPTKGLNLHLLHLLHWQAGFFFLYH